jgi:CheY-like chemotaxis protein
VKDQGQGIPQDELETLFRPFQQTSVKSTSGEKSTGLGLLICRKIIEAHGGALWVESEVGKGSTFAFSLPLATEPTVAQPPMESRPLGALSQPEPYSLRVLVAEDEAVNQKIIVRLLERLGYQADVVADGADVLTALERRNYGVVFMDLHMPKMGGLEATRQIRQRWPERQGLRIIALTASTLPEEREQCRAAGMDGYLSKPIGLETLRQILTRIGLPPKDVKGAC